MRSRYVDLCQLVIEGCVSSDAYVGHMQTVALGSSVFCGLFTEEEWKGFEYYFGTPLHADFNTSS